MATKQQTQDLGNLTPPFAGLTGLTIFGWIIFGLFSRFDEDNYYFAATMILAGLLAAYQLRHLRKSRNPIEGGTVAFFVIIWLAVVSFTSSSSRLQYGDYTISLTTLEFIALLPLTLIWVQPYNDEKFFGVMDLGKNDKLHAVWRTSVLFLIIIKIIPFGNEWYFDILEYLILIPMIYETVQLQKNKEEELPVLTLFIQTEMAEKFAVPLSMFKSVFFIMLVFLFGILDSRFWLLVILGYFGAGLIYGISILIPPEMKDSDEAMDDFADNVRQFFGASEEKRRRGRRRRERRREKKKKKEEGSMPLPVSPEIEDSSALIPVQADTGKLTSQLSGNTISEKAHALGKRVRTGIEKPYYTLNHILSTLKAEDFSQAWRVQEKGLIFPSTKGNWNPPVGLIIFPIELGKYDYRRSDEILLLGFNTPIESKENQVSFEIGDSSKYNVKISDNAIKFGDVQFNTRSLIVDIEDWELIKSQLEIVTDQDDISYTGFKTLNQMQEVLASLSDKWLELRLTAQEATVNFLAGMLGSSEPVFIPREGLEKPNYPMIDASIEKIDEITDIDEK